MHNGLPISEKERTELFSFKHFTESEEGYELWRAHNYITKSNGSLTFSRESDFDCFFIELPRESNSKLVYIIDDEKIWRSLFSRWLEQAGFDVEVASNEESAKKLLGRNDIPRLILIDVALGSSGSESVAGLSLIDFINDSLLPRPKIALMTDSESRDNKYVTDIDFIKKVNSKGDVITKNDFLSYIDDLIY
ncbi:MAG: response regulator [Gammaproteobacteria bacterium]|nr:response regulator [Gammaproteobacteria bacterium]MBU1722618.1 response regulator [Gammaproteobacteria bacterium]MBU2007090.1 response regulator [Gammaproteobacteria bacterium]